MKFLLLASLALAGTALAGAVAEARPSKATVRVTEREFHITVSTTHARSGQTQFQIDNVGKLPHALAIAGHGVSARTKTIKPGKSATLTVDLEEGAYSSWCPVPGHAAKGMKTKVSVTGTTPAG